MTLQTERIYIRSLTQSDADAMQALRERNRAFLEPFEPIQSDESFTLGAVRQTIEQYITDQANDLSYSFGIFLRDTDALIGRIRLSNVFRGPWQNANLGYFLAEEANGKGYTTEAVGLVLRFAFEEAHLHRVQAGIMPRNLGSIRVAEKNGMRPEGLAKRYLKINGVWEDHVIYAMTTEEWLENNR
ncbi:GNAT family N-acetyltransferase [Paenibacillus cremeus]|uniref:GNAT family N-acetyltransferase n=1 Tax=Paenibacillus cremeus TaxID=2163881 RepID=A0A559K3L9_9BACL|nr:GNAT family protein [Paenibacillus cremeus]TVY06735.1 GNAT family N-acetyltransferase [Paenibacillus cremeus]